MIGNPIVLYCQRVHCRAPRWALLSCFEAHVFRTLHYDAACALALRAQSPRASMINRLTALYGR